MSNLGNKKIIAQNIRYYMNVNNVTQTDLCNTLGFKIPTLSDWLHAKTYPRIDKIEMLANYFGIEKSDLIEDRKDNIAELVISDENMKKIITHYDKLNQIGKQEAEKRIEELTYIDKYTNSVELVNAAHEISGAAEKEKQHDEDIMNDENF